MMKRFLLLFILGLSVMRPALLVAQNLSLSEALDLALQHSHLLKSQNAKIRAAGAAQDTATSHYYPHLSAELGQSQLFFPPNDYRQQFGSAKLDWSPGNWFKKTALLATKQIEVQQSEKQQVSLDLIRRVSILYLGILRNQQEQTLLENRLKIFDKHRQVAEALWQGGIRTQLDVLQTQVAMNRLLEQQKVRQSETRNLKMTLNTLLSLPKTQPLQLQDMPSSAIDIVPDVLKNSLIQNPRLRSTQLKAEVQQLRLREVSASKWPRLQLRGDYVVDRDPTAQGDYWKLGIGIQIPIFLRGETGFRQREIKAQMQSLLWERTQVRRETNIQYAQIAQDLDRLRQSYHLQRQRLEIIQQSLEIATANYEAGLITNLEYLDAQKKEVGIQVTLNETRLAYVLRLIDNYILDNHPEKINRIQGAPQ